MRSPVFTVHSMISSRLMKHTLFKGACFGLAGITVILIGGILLPVSILQTWGLPIFLVGIGLITFGMIPYRRLSRLQLKPNAIICNSSGYLEYYSRGNKQFSIPIRSIAKVAHENDELYYGISVWIKRPCSSPVIIHNGCKGLDRMRSEGMALSGADFFIPYFNKRAFEEISRRLRNKSSKTSLNDIMEE